ncbi:MAG: aldose epimerase family protein, partial [Candidatus Dormiibacterota bacterium]
MQAARTPFTFTRALAMLAVAAVLVASAALTSSRGTRAAAGDAGGRPVTVSEREWGTLDGQQVNLYTLTNRRGMQVAISNYGGIVQAIRAPDRGGRLQDVALGFNDLADYVAKSPYFGAIVGRYANRIANGTFVLDGVTYHIPINNPPNALHGGTVGFDKHVWQATEVTQGAAAGLDLELVSPNGDMGFPGTLTVHVTYLLTPDDQMEIHYHATTDAPTVVNLSNHTYWNLAGEGSGTVENQLMQINADSYTPVDSVSIPTGAIESVAGTPMDFRRPAPIGAHLRDDFQQLLNVQGYDHNWV